MVWIVPIATNLLKYSAWAEAKPRESSETASNVLVIHSLDDLKARLAKVILMILIVKFFEHAIGMIFDTPLDLLYLAAGITLIGAAIYISHAEPHSVGKTLKGNGESHKHS